MFEQHTSPEDIRISRRAFIGASTLAIGVAALSGSGLLYFDALGKAPPSLNPYVDVATEYQYGAERGSSPIVILGSGAGPGGYGPYLGEILVAEGLNCFRILDPTEVPSTDLQRHKAVIVAASDIRGSILSSLLSFADRGGTLVLMRPEGALASFLSVAPSQAQMDQASVEFIPGRGGYSGGKVDHLRVHGPISLYRPGDAEVLAWLRSEDLALQSYPAVFRHQVGKGSTITFAFDLARSIALSRQGNPGLANRPDPRWEGNRAINQFVGWFDLDEIETPQADELQRRFIDILGDSIGGLFPLPRLWYFPENADSLIVATGDSHINPASSIEEELTLVEQFGGHLSVYYTPLIVSTPGRMARRGRTLLTDYAPLIGSYLSQEFDAPTPGQISQWRERGHEFTLHPYVEAGLQEGWSSYWHEFTGRDYGPISKTTRTHRILWSGYLETAKVQAGYGIELNNDFYHWGPLFQDPAGDWRFGYFTGSGLPMRFVDQQGKIIKTYQLLTELADDHMLSLHWGGVAELAPDRAVNASEALIARAAREYPSAITVQFHVDPYAVGGWSAANAKVFLLGTLGAAAERSLPIVSAKEYLAFIRFRRSINFRHVRWQAEDRRLIIGLSSDSKAEFSVPLLLPKVFGKMEVAAVTADGAEIPLEMRKLGGQVYSYASIPAGSQEVVGHYS